jgi:hypothetical protein
VLQRQSLCVAPGVLEASSAHVRMLLPRLRLVDTQQAAVAREIALRLATLSASDQQSGGRDARILRSMPGIGPIICATLLTEGWEPLAARDGDRLRALTGVAPVTRSSGKFLRGARPPEMSRASRLAACAPRGGPYASAALHPSNVKRPGRGLGTPPTATTPLDGLSASHLRASGSQGAIGIVGIVAVRLQAARPARSFRGRGARASVAPDRRGYLSFLRSFPTRRRGSAVSFGPSRKVSSPAWTT